MESISPSKKESVFKDEAIPFIIFNGENKKYEVAEEAKEMLGALDGPMGVIAVAGMYRTGKSYLLNRMLLNQSSGFDVGPTVNACTKGIWMWGRPINGITPDNEKLQVLVLDTEGLAALDEDSNHDVRIFSLAILLSSYFIYNSMGSIDENALQNLNLVCNLTKNIQVKSQGNGGSSPIDTDPEELAAYFPSFMWVVRDFTLQLVDTEGDPINSREYFEQALKEQKGYSEAIENKNRIRRMLKSFFKERDCCTMVRPTTKEDNLQKLAELELDQLRGEFVEQVTTLRRKVINRIKPKTLNGQRLNGPMLVNLADSYSKAINQGAVPSIQSSWQYICENECNKAVQDSFEFYDKQMYEGFNENAPMFEEDLKYLSSESKKKAIEQFSKVAVGENKDDFLKSLKEKIKQKYEQYKTNNQSRAQTEIENFLLQNFMSIEQKVHQQEYGSMEEFTEDIAGFIQYFTQSGPAGPNRDVIVQHFCYQKLQEGAEFFFKGLVNELTLQQQSAEQSMKQLKDQLDELKEDKKALNAQYEGKLKKLEMEKVEASAREQSAKENFASLQKEKIRIEQETKELMQEHRKETSRMTDEFQQKLSAHEEQSKQASRAQMAAESEHDKEKALLNQKIEFYEKSHEENQKKEKDLTSQLLEQKRDFHNQNKDQIQKYEAQIKQLTQSTDKLKEDNFEQESKLDDLEHKYENDTTDLKENIQKLQKENAKLQASNDELNKKYDQLQKSYNNDITEQKSNLESEKAHQNNLITDLNEQLKQVQDELNSSKQKWEKDQALYKQKMDFYEMQVVEAKNKNEEQRKQHEQMIKTIQGNQRESVIGKQEANQKLNELKDKFEKQCQDMQYQFDQNETKMTTEIENLTNQKQELELKLHGVSQDYQKDVTEVRDQLSQCEDQRDRAYAQIKALEQQKSSITQETEDRYRSQLHALENELEQKGVDSETTIAEIQHKAEEQIAALRAYYDGEKERLERRQNEEKDRASKRYLALQEDWEMKLHEQQTNWEDDMAMQEEEAKMAIHEKNEDITQLSHDLGLAHQQIENLNQHLAETKEALAKLQTMHAQQIESQQVKYENDFSTLTVKHETSQANLAKKEKLLSSLEQQLESLNDSLAKRESELKELRTETQSEKGNLNQKMQTLKDQLNAKIDELTQLKIDTERERALKEQQITFQDQRVKELNEHVDKTVQRYEERIKQEREDLLKEWTDKTEKLEAEKLNCENKYDAKRRALKDLENERNKQIANFERERAVLEEKIGNLESGSKNHIENLEQENIKLRQEIQTIHEQGGLEKGAMQEELEKQKFDFAELERQLTDALNNYDRDRALWQGKFNFLEETKNQHKKDLDEAQLKFQENVEQLQKMQSDGKSKTEQTHQQILAQQEAKYNARLKDLQDQANETVYEAQQKAKLAERELKQLQEKHEMHTKNSMTEQGSLSKKYEKITEELERVQLELEQIKSDRDKRVRDYQTQIDKLREEFNAKKRELEKKNTQIESNKTALILNHERERAKWDQQMTDLSHQTEDAKSDLERTKIRLENFMKENERLKNDQRNRMRNLHQATDRTTNQTSAYVGAGLLNKLNLQGVSGENKGGFKPGMYNSNKDGETSQRTTFKFSSSNPMNQSIDFKGGVSSAFKRDTNVSQSAAFPKGENRLSLVKESSSSQSSQKKEPEQQENNQ